jgi:Domain of unknown function (DUF5666)
MKRSNLATSTRPPHLGLRPMQRWLLSAGLGLSTLILAACGGGGDGSSASNGVGVGGTGSAAGPVTGFGSIIVNGVRFDDSRASIKTDDDASTTVKLGAMVEVNSGSIGALDDTGLSNATASQIVVASTLKGKVSNKVGNTFTLLGQTVTVNAGTAYEDFAGGYSALATGQFVEVHAFEGVPGQYTATRVERKTPDSNTICKLTGLVSGLNSSAGTFVIGGWSVSYSGLGATIPSNLANGLRVRVKLNWDNTSGICTTTASKVSSAVFSPSDNTKLEIEGAVTARTSNTSFSVNGVPVSASGSVAVVLGQRVEVEGVMQGGVLVASKVEDKTSSGGNDVRLFGSASNVNLSAKTFVIKGLTVAYDLGDFDNGVSEANLSDGANLEVRGELATDGATVIATEIKLKN